MKIDPADLRAGDCIDLGRGPVKVRDVLVDRHLLTGLRMYVVLREPDGRREAIYNENDEVERVECP